ncbi:MAG: hypothetical protein LC115_08930 [Bacteroidia bacterium]|nr:hypothetical protein [Bacteroidia bacterium]
MENNENTISIQQVNQNISDNSNILVETSWAGSATLKQALAVHQVVIIHFLRDLGCIYCRGLVDRLYKTAQQKQNLPPLLFVHFDSVSNGQAFFQEHFPNSLHIADTEQKLYQLFGIQKITWASFLNFKMWLTGISFFLKGYFPKKQTDPSILSGTFLLKEGSVIWKHLARYPGDDTLFPSITSR